MQILFDSTYLDYIQYIRNRYNFNLNLNEDNVTCFPISSGKLFHNSTPLCRSTFDVIWSLQKLTCNLPVCRVAIVCVVFVLVNILFNTSGSIPVLNLYIITNTHCLYIGRLSVLMSRKFISMCYKLRFAVIYSATVYSFMSYLMLSSHFSCPPFFSFAAPT